MCKGTTQQKDLNRAYHNLMYLTLVNILCTYSFNNLIITKAAECGGDESGEGVGLRLW